MSDHDRDTEDLPDDPYFDPVSLNTKGQRRHGEPFFDPASYLAKKADNKVEADSEEVQVLIKEQAEEDMQEMGELTRQFNEKKKKDREAAMSDKELKES